MIKKKKLIALFVMWTKIMHLVNCFFHMMSTIIFYYMRKKSLKGQRYHNDFFARKTIVYDYAYASDDTSVSQLRMNRRPFIRLCFMLETIEKLKETKNMEIDEQVAIFLHILAHHVKNRVIKQRFKRSSETISRHFQNVLNAVIRLQGHLLKTPEPVLEDSTDEK